MQIQWSEDLAVGNTEIDSQHQELLKRLNVLWSALSQGTGREEITKVIEFLEHYVLIHFNTEENQMAIHQYPDIELHKEKHREFIAMYENLQEKLEKDGPNSALAAQTLNALFKWFIVHIKHMDRELGAFLK